MKQKKNSIRKKNQISAVYLSNIKKKQKLVLKIVSLKKQIQINPVLFINIKNIFQLIYFSFN